MRLIDLKKRLGDRAEQSIRDEIERLRLEWSEFEREHRELKEDALSRLQRWHSDAGGNVEALARAHAHELPSLPSIVIHGTAPTLADLYLLWRMSHDVEFHAWLSSMVDAADGFSSISRSEFDAKVHGFGREIKSLEVELERRELEQREAAAAAERAALEQRVAS